MKASQIQTNEQGNTFAITYNKDEKVHLLVFNVEAIINNLDTTIVKNLNQSIGVRSNILNPYSVCCFIDSDKLFCAMFNKNTL